MKLGRVGKKKVTKRKKKLRDMGRRKEFSKSRPIKGFIYLRAIPYS